MTHIQPAQAETMRKPILEGKADKQIAVREVTRERINKLGAWLTGEVQEKFSIDETIYVLLTTFENLHPGSTTGEKGVTA